MTRRTTCNKSPSVRQSCQAMRNSVFIIMFTLATVCFAHRSCAQGTLAPLSLFTSGSGEISPFQDGQMLEVGQSYEMTAIPDDGYVFSSWQPVNVFTFTQITPPLNGWTNPPIVSIVLSPLREFTDLLVLEFTMQPVTVIQSGTPSIMITESSGWQANFVPVPEPSGIALILCGLTTIAFLRMDNFTTARRKRQK